MTNMFYRLEKRESVVKLVCLILSLLFILGLTSCEYVEDDIYPLPTDVISSTEPISSEELEVHFIDVGQADSILIKIGENAMLIDAGDSKSGDTIISYLTAENITKLDYLIGTHPHEDHMGSFADIVNNFEIGNIILTEKVNTGKYFKRAIEAIENKNLSVTKAVVGDKYELGDAEFIILSPSKDYGDNLNNASIIIRLTYGENSFLFTGDAEKEPEGDVVSSGFELKSDVLKFGHHGSSTSSSDSFLKAVSPTYGVIMCGKDNSYGHPHKETLDKIKKYGIIVYRTDEVGNIVAVSNGKDITWETGKALIQDKVETGYVLNVNSKKFHLPTCSSVEKISDKNREEFTGSREDLIAKGYSPCGTCNP